MSNKKQLEIYETAIACAFYRMTNEEISNDPFAKHLVNPKIKDWAELYRTEVSKAEDIAHSLRHRFFLEELKSFASKHKKIAFINFGAGFSFYPYLIEGNHVYIEIDQLEIIEAKKKIVSQLNSSGNLPIRNIHHIQGDLNNEGSFNRLKELIAPLINKQPSFILIEGVIFYLKKEILPGLFNLFASLQQPEDIMGAVSYTPEISNTSAYKRLSDFFKNYLQIEQENHTNLEPDYYKNINKYQLIKHQEYFKLYQTFVNNNCPHKADDILNEHMYLLKRKV